MFLFVLADRLVCSTIGYCYDNASVFPPVCPYTHTHTLLENHTADVHD